MHYPKLRELKEAIISLVTPAYTTKFPKKPHIPAENFRGKPVIDDKNCVGCQACANVCPTHAITYTDDVENKKRTIIRDYGKCIFCGQCEAACITQKGVKLSNKIYDLSVFDRSVLIEKQEKELLICDSCNAIITTKEHFEYMHNKLGAKSYASILSLNLLNERLKLAPNEEVEVKVVDDLKRKDMFSILCPNCNRKIQLKNLS